MKKTIALLAIASLFAVANAADDTTTWEFATKDGSAAVGGYAGIQFSLPGADRLDSTPSEVGATLGDLVTLNSITIRVGSGSGTTTGDRLMYLTDSNNTLLAVSQVTTLAGANTDATFTFDAVTDLTATAGAANSLTLNVGETYYAYFAVASVVSGLDIGDTVGSGQYNSIRLAGVGGFDASTADQLAFLGSQASVSGPTYAPIVTISVTSATPAVPEPATATLSLLALAGLAARRRRK